jgi:hypothetical protein
MIVSEMSDSYVKDIVYDLIGSKLRIKELEDKLTALELENNKLTHVNKELESEVNKWKTQVVAYINDYREIYTVKECKDNMDIIVNTTVNTDVNNIVNKVDSESVLNEDTNSTLTTDETKKSRKEYMREYMKNKRQKEKDARKLITVNKK